MTAIPLLGKSLHGFVWLPQFVGYGVITGFSSNGFSHLFVTRSNITKQVACLLQHAFSLLRGAQVVGPNLSPEGIRGRTEKPAEGGGKIGLAVVANGKCYFRQAEVGIAEQ